ncbi:DUF3429 domain-containing protein [Psychrosphaera aestuarii]|uniref:DUF3429 domain-containing protein n=1 Tax=Psychrosphaera aestuarii TaxID=1266052 RepID=UPI001B3456F3|nr:DUF3429 domain-containing protein [Psychrosphaera aestuarii]
MNTVSNESTIDSSLQSTVTLFSYCGLLPFLYFAACAWFPGLNLFETEPLTVFRAYSAVILSFLAGTLWVFGLIATQYQQQVEVRSKSLIWSAIFLSVIAWGNLFIAGKAALFVAGLLFLVVWQIEQKTELTKCYPAWYTELRAKLSMIVGALHIIIWLTIS